MAGNAVHFPQKLGPYELVRLLATGGMAEVYLARRDGPHGFSKTVALKRILPQLARDQDFVAMFIDEARVCAQLSHPNLVQVFDFGEAGSELYMAMEFVDGTTCAKAVRKAAAMSETVPLDAVLHIVLSVLRGLEYAHAAVDLDGIPLGLVHRDVSPGNILMARSGAVKLSDFGIARADDFERRTEEGQLKGKLGYMSPEQVTGRAIDARSDLFTLAIVLAELLIVRPLFGTGNELDVLMRIRDADLSMFDRYAGHVPGELRNIVRTALSQDPADRYQTAGEFAEAIEDFARHTRIPAGAPRLVSWLAHTDLIPVLGSGEHVLDGLRASARAGKVRSSHTSLARKSTPRPGAIRDTRISNHDFPQPGDTPERARHVSPAEFRITIGEETLGPLPYARLVELFATGKAAANSLVARGVGPFRPAREMPELARLLLSPALTGPPEAPEDQRERWELERVTHPQRIFDLVSRKETGLLIAEQGTRRKMFYFVDGAPTYTTSTDKNELLGQQLVASGQALPMEIDMALAVCPRYGGRLGDALVGLGVLRPVELFRALVAQTHERMVDLIGWREGSLQFIRGVRADGETILHGASSVELITKGIVEGYEEVEIVEMLAPFVDNEIRPGPPKEFGIRDLRLQRRLASVLTAIDRAWQLRELLDNFAEQGHAGRDDVLRAVFVGLSARLLITTGWPPSVERPSVPTKRMY